MEFDEYDYLEKAVEETNGTPSKKDSPPPSKEKDRDRSDKGYRRRDRNEEDEFDEEERENRKSSSKKSRSEDNGRERDKERSRDRERSSRHRSKERESERRSSRDRDRDIEKDRRSSRDVEKDRRSSRDVEKDRRSSRDVEKDRRSSRDVEKDRRSSRDREPEMEHDRSSKDRDRDRERRDREKERDRERREREKERERERRSRSRSRLEVVEREFGRERDREESRRYKDKKDAEPEADPERDQRTVFAYQMPLKATERDVFEFFSQAGKVRDVKLIMDRNSRRSKGVGYIEFVDVMSVPMAIAMSGRLFLGQPIMVKPSEAEKNLVQSNTSTGAGVTGQYATDRKLYVGNLHFNMTEPQLKQIFEAFGPVELVQLPTDPETGHCKGFGFVQFIQLEHAKAAQSLNGKLEIAGRTIKVSCVTDHVGVQDSGAKTADFDDDDGGGLALNAQSRALLMQKLDRSGIASSVVGPLGVPAVNGAAPLQQGMTLPMNPAAGLSAPLLPAQIPIAPEPIGIPSECLLLKNMFDPATEEEPEFDLDIRDDVHEECSKYGRVKHIHVDKDSAGYVYLRFESVEAASRAQQAMHHRWFARRLISAIFLQPYEYDAKFKGAA